MKIEVLVSVKMVRRLLTRSNWKLKEMLLRLVAGVNLTGIWSVRMGSKVVLMTTITLGLSVNTVQTLPRQSRIVSAQLSENQNLIAGLCTRVPIDVLLFSCIDSCQRSFMRPPSYRSLLCLLFHLTVSFCLLFVYHLFCCKSSSLPRTPPPTLLCGWVWLLSDQGITPCTSALFPAESQCADEPWTTLTASKTNKKNNLQTCPPGNLHDGSLLLQQLLLFGVSYVSDVGRRKPAR